MNSSHLRDLALRLKRPVADVLYPSTTERVEIADALLTLLPPDVPRSPKDKVALVAFEMHRQEKTARWEADYASASLIEQRVAQILCQHGRLTRDMPSSAEMGRALPIARALIKEARDAP